MTTRIGGPRRWRWLSIVAIANLAAVGLVAAPSQAQGASLCSGTAENFTIRGDLAVPAGASCLLINSTVTGDVVVRAEANLALEGSTVRGDITVRNNGFLDSIESTLREDVRLRGAFGAVLEGSELRDRVDVRNSGFLVTDRSTHQDDLVSRTGQTVVLSSRIFGNLRTSGDLLTDVEDSVVTGQLRVSGAELGSVICRSEIDRNAVLTEVGVLVQLGVGAFADCEFNVFGGSVALHDNTGDIVVGGNVIRGDLDCTGNQVEPTGSDNRVRGELLGQCVGLDGGAPAALPSPSRATPNPAAEDRVADVLDQAADRSAVTRAAATLAGSANL